MSLVVVGSVALDSVETPVGRRDDILGGAASFFSVTASLLTKVSLVGVVGDDFPEAHVTLFREKGVDLTGLMRAPGKTFRWAGRYSADFATRTTLDTQLNVFADWRPTLPPSYRAAEYVFLANIHPTLQGRVLDEIARPKFVAMDTMNYWIEGTPVELRDTLKRVDALIINEEEARMLAGATNLLEAARGIRTLGPRILVVKRGEYGAVLFTEDDTFALPAYPLARVVDPTGAGDSFAGGFMGEIARRGASDADALRSAVAMGTVTGSFSVEDFGLDRVRTLGANELFSRRRALATLVRIPEL
ncbi:MAG: sugar kinase [Deltaproteobacteria bacterium]|nr:sugar kinase [Deltaproteobacteria bacterium]